MKTRHSADNVPVLEFWESVFDIKLIFIELFYADDCIFSIISTIKFYANLKI